MLVVSAVLIACVPTSVSVGELAVLRKGMEPSEVSSALKDKEPQFSLPMVIDGQAYRVDAYILSAGGYRSDYFLAYDEDRLMFWGYPHEFARSKNELINRMGRKGVEALEEKQRWHCE